MSLQQIQQRLKAPKSQFNSFGQFHYRNLEDILEAVKPLLAEYKYSLVITDDIVLIGDRYYVKAMVELFNEAGKVFASNSAFAREAAEKKGMDASQITGAASSYARKYALNGLFCIDDTKDADSDAPAKKQPESQPKAVELTENEMADIVTSITDCRTETDLNALYEELKDKISKAPNRQEIIQMFSTRKQEIVPPKDKE